MPARLIIGPGVVRRFRLAVVEGPARGLAWESTGDRCLIGSHKRNDLVIDDPTVSRFHCEISVDAGGPRIRDAKSRNGTIVDGVVVLEAFLRNRSLVRLGKTVLQFEVGSGANQLPLCEEAQFGTLYGASVAMRVTCGMLTRAAATDATVLLEGETGTGKSQAAISLHRRSARSAGPFITVDCGAVPSNLLESELFGHEKGAFTGATDRRLGAFEAASGGTIFLDEIGELPMDLQPKLLRVLEEREIRRIGSNEQRPVDVRVIAATNRELRAEVNAGRFRADLYYRLAVVTISIPPLRQRPEDIPILVDQILASLHAPPDAQRRLRSPELLARLQSAAWLGNVRELRNYLERCLILSTDTLDGEGGGDDARSEGQLAIDPTAPYAIERERVLAEFERRYFRKLLALHDGKVSRAASAAGMDRRYLYRLLHRHGIER